MSAAKHTPGPWKWDRYEGVTTPTGRQLLATGVSLVAGIASSSEPEWNARLIAAAPELLEALRHMTEWAEAFRDSADHVPLAYREAARAAIAKAEGR